MKRCIFERRERERERERPSTMTDREEDPTAFSVVVNGQIELAEVRFLFDSLLTVFNLNVRGREVASFPLFSFFLYFLTYEPLPFVCRLLNFFHHAGAREPEWILQVLDNSRRGLAGLGRSRGRCDATVEEIAWNRHLLCVELPHQRSV